MRFFKIESQRLRLFFAQLFVFTCIFLFLGLTLFHFIQKSMYQNEDQQLERQSQNTEVIQTMILRQLSQKGNNQLVPPPLEGQRESFQIQMIIWSEDGEILNPSALGERYFDFADLKLNTSELNTVQEVKLKKGDQETLYFRSIVQKINLIPTNQTYYVQTMINTNQIRETIRQVLRILIISLIICEIVSITLSMYLSKRNMRPILSSWQKQQDFVEDAAHEMRTPLTIIQNQLEKLLIRPENTIMQHSADIGSALSETRRLTLLTNDLLMLTRQNEEVKTVFAEEVELSAFLAELVEPYREIAQVEGKTFVLNDLTGNRQVKLDVNQMRQLCVILIDNAIKYTKAGDKISVTSKITKREEWQFEVFDTGCGIREENREKIFDRFFREDASRHKKNGGYGLGLAIAKKIIENHHGKLTVRANEPKGSIFTFLIKI